MTVFLSSWVSLAQAEKKGTLVVCAQCPIKTISQAVHSAHKGDTILVKAGEYEEETLSIKTTVHLIGEEGATLIHRGEGDMILVTAPDTTIKGLKIIGSGKSTYQDFSAVKIANTSGCRIVDNEIVDSQYGVMVANSTHCVVSGNTITTKAVASGLQGDGIHFWKTSDSKITGNRVQGHRDGIYLEFSTDGEIFDNVITNNHRYGLHFMFANDNEFRNNIFRSNDAGVAVMYSKRIRMLRNEYSDNAGAASYGLLLKDITDSEITENEFLGNTVAIFMEGSNRNRFFLNRFDKNGWTIRLLSSCESNVFQNNAFLNNALAVATNSHLNLNTFQQNYWAQHKNVDLDHNGYADLPYQPTSFSSFLLEKHNVSILLVGSPVLKLLDWAEQMFPAISPVSLKDPMPLMNFPPRKR